MERGTAPERRTVGPSPAELLRSAAPDRASAERVLAAHMRDMAKNKPQATAGIPLCPVKGQLPLFSLHGQPAAPDEQTHASRPPADPEHPESGDGNHGTAA